MDFAGVNFDDEHVQLSESNELEALAMEQLVLFGELKTTVRMMNALVRAFKNYTN